MKIKDIPEYVLNPSYKMTHIMVAEVENGLFQYRRCFTTKSAATRRFNTVTTYVKNVAIFARSLTEKVNLLGLCANVIFQT